MLCEVSLNFVRDEINQFVAVEDGIQQECAAIAEATAYVIHVQISLYVARYKVRRVYLIG